MRAVYDRIACTSFTGWERVFKKRRELRGKLGVDGRVKDTQQAFQYKIDFSIEPRNDIVIDVSTLNPPDLQL
jgi:hypothetical protein